MSQWHARRAKEFRRLGAGIICDLWSAKLGARRSDSHDRARNRVPKTQLPSSNFNLPRIISARGRRHAFANLNSEGGSSSPFLDATKLYAFAAKITSPAGATDPPCFYFGTRPATLFSKHAPPWQRSPTLLLRLIVHSFQHGLSPTATSAPSAPSGSHSVSAQNNQVSAVVAMAPGPCARIASIVWWSGRVSPFQQR